MEHGFIEQWNKQCLQISLQKDFGHDIEIVLELTFLTYKVFGARICGVSFSTLEKNEDNLETETSSFA